MKILQGSVALNTFCTPCHTEKNAKRPYGNDAAFKKEKLKKPGGCKERDQVIRAINGGEMPMQKPISNEQKKALTNYIGRLSAKTSRCAERLDEIYSQNLSTSG